MTQATSDPRTTNDGTPSDTLIAVNLLVDNASKALADFESFTQEQVDHIVAKRRWPPWISTPPWPARRWRRPGGVSSRTRR